MADFVPLGLFLGCIFNYQVKNPVKFILQLNRGIRTLLSWYRDYARGKMKNLDVTDEAIFSAVVEELVLPPPSAVKEDVGTHAFPKHLVRLCLAWKVICIVQGYFQKCLKIPLK